MRLAEAYQWALTEDGVRTGREYMDRPMMIENELMLLYSKMDAVRDSMRSALSMTGSKGHNLPGDKTGETASRLCDLESQIEQKLLSLSGIRREREILLSEVDDFDARLALRCHCLEQLSGAAAAKKLHMDERQYYRKLRLGYSLIAMQLAIRDQHMAKQQTT